MKLKYSLLVTLGAISYGTLTSFAKISYTEGYLAAEITFAQAFLGAFVLWIAVFVQQIFDKKTKLKMDWKIILSGTSVGLSAYCFYLSVKYIPVSLAIVLLMQVSWISSLIEWLVFKKKMSKKEIGITIVILIGTVFASGVSKEFSNISIFGVMLSILAALIYSIYILSSSRLSNDKPMLQKSAMMMTGSAFIILVINAKTIITSTHFDLGLLKWGAFLAIFGTVIPPICFNTGMPKIGAGLSAVLITLELPAVVLCAYLILGEKVSLMQIFGITVMVGSIVALNMMSKKGESKNGKATSLERVKCKNLE